MGMCPVLFVSQKGCPSLVSLSKIELARGPDDSGGGWVCCVLILVIAGIVGYLIYAGHL